LKSKDKSDNYVFHIYCVSEAHQNTTEGALENSTQEDMWT